MSFSNRLANTDASICEALPIAWASTNAIPKIKSSGICPLGTIVLNIGSIATTGRTEITAAIAKNISVIMYLFHSGENCNHANCHFVMGLLGNLDINAKYFKLGFDVNTGNF